MRFTTDRRVDRQAIHPRAEAGRDSSKTRARNVKDRLARTFRVCTAQRGVESRYDEYVHGSGARSSGFAVHNWRAITALFATSTFLESLALGPDGLHAAVPSDTYPCGKWGRHLDGLLSAATFAVASARALWGRAGPNYRQADHRAQPVPRSVAYVIALSPDLTWFFVSACCRAHNRQLRDHHASQTLHARTQDGVGHAVVRLQSIAMTIGPPLGTARPIIGVRGLFLVDGFRVAAVLVTLLMPNRRPHQHPGICAARSTSSGGDRPALELRELVLDPRCRA
jgi:hypothetical protein